MAGKAEIITNSAQLRLELGLSLAKVDQVTLIAVPQLVLPSVGGQSWSVSLPAAHISSSEFNLQFIGILQNIFSHYQVRYKKL